MALPVHRWFRYSAGFSALWAREVLTREKSAGRTRVLDPFAGSGTILLEAEAASSASIGVEAHPFVARIARAKLAWRTPYRRFREYALAILETARAASPPSRPISPLLADCYPPETLQRLETLRFALETQSDGTACSELTWLALVSILRECSPAGTAQLQYILPSKTKARFLDPYDAFLIRINLMADDMRRRQSTINGPVPALYAEDARQCASLPSSWANLIITSPPYANNYDYADATRLEMTFFGEIEGWADLQYAVRRHLIRSCTQHVAREATQTPLIILDPLLDPIREALTDVCNRLEAERENHGGKKPYHTMVASYFLDMANVWASLRRVAQPGCLACFVVGDSAPYGIHVPVDKWLGELAIAAGFHSYSFEKTRERNVKWKNRKHRIPLHEGRLWVQG